jgi:hypothetical protein
MNKYVSSEALYALLANDDVLLFCPPWRFQRQHKHLHTDLLYRFGFRRLGTVVPASASLNSRWAPLTIYHNYLLPNKEMCIIYMPQRPIIVTYIDVLHRHTMKLYSFVHIPDIPVTDSNCYTPFPVLENERSFTGQATIPSRTKGFDITRAVDADVGSRVASELMHTLAEASPATAFPLQGTTDGYYWKSPRHWMCVEPRLKQFHEQDHVFLLADIVLQIRNIIQATFCAVVEATAGICEVFFHTAVSSKRRNLRSLPILSLSEMQSVANDANDSLTLKALMCTSVTREEGDGEFHPVESLVFDPWLLFAIRNFLPRESTLFSLVQNTRMIEPVDGAVVIVARETYLRDPAVEYTRVWTDTLVDITTEECGQEGIPVVTVTSPLVAQMDNDGILGRTIDEIGGISSEHGQSQHTTTIILMGDTAYTYDDTIPFLIKASNWDRDALKGALDSPMYKLQGLLMDMHPFSNESTAEEVL